MADRSDRDTSFLYPLHGDPQFSFKLASRKEFADTAEGTVDLNESVEEISKRLCSAEFELAPHQAFVRNFLSFQTPYDGLLLYHGLGTGKTCSAITVCEEMRAYMLQMDIAQRIIVVASPNVQDNFKLQLFDHRKLALVDGLWNLQACTGNSFIQEINPMAMRGLSREVVISQIQAIIRKSYLFLGYLEFANYIAGFEQDEKDSAISKSKIQKVFKGRLIVIDEVHNIREGEETKGKKVAAKLEMLIQNAGGLRLLFLSATPMYNSPKEIAWLLNLLHVNDGRAAFGSKDIFNRDGTLVDAEVTGTTVLAEKALGYVSFVKGDNPFTFPFRVWPSLFAPEVALMPADAPEFQMNKRPVVQGIEHLSLYPTQLGVFQELAYNHIVEGLKERSVSRAFEDLDGFGYTLLQRPLEALIMAFPSPRLEEGGHVSSESLVGAKGLSRVMSFTVDKSTSKRSKFSYKKGFKSQKPFAPANIGKYSAKIANLVESAEQSRGVVLAYTQYIDGGIVPCALALEERGFTRATPGLGLLERPPPSNGSKYIIISGDRGLSPDNAAEVVMATNESNKDGDDVKVILITLAGSEGIDLKFVRQVHVLDPWYNMNRIEQIIGRAVRNCSHKDLPLSQRNVMIFLYVSLLPSTPDIEAADIYVYRSAETKALAIGRASRVLKENAVDCLLRSGQESDLEKLVVEQELSSGRKVEMNLGPKPYSAGCDYMAQCQYKCKPVAAVSPEDVTLDTLAKPFITANTDRIIGRVRQLFRQRYFYSQSALVAEINAGRSYPLIQIYAGLERLLADGNEFLTDKYGRAGRLQNYGDLYVFSPLEVTGNEVSLYDRVTPVAYKRKYIVPTTRSADKSDVRQREARQGAADDFYSRLEYAMTASTEIDADDAWYKSANAVLKVMERVGMDMNACRDAVVGHAFDSLFVGDQIAILETLEDENPIGLKGLVSKYVDENSIETSSGPAWLGLEGETPVLLVKDKGRWRKAEGSVVRKAGKELQAARAMYVPLDEKCGPIIGFLAPWKGKSMVFKTKDTKAKRNKGARCDQATKASLVKRLALVAPPSLIEDSSLGRADLCCALELVLRMANKKVDRGKKWFAIPGLMTLILSR